MFGYHKENDEKMHNDEQEGDDLYFLFPFAIFCI